MKIFSHEKFWQYSSRVLAHLVVIVLWVVKWHCWNLSDVSSKHLQSIYLLLKVRALHYQYKHKKQLNKIDG